MTPTFRRFVIIGALALAAGTSVLAQRGGFPGLGSSRGYSANVPYDGKFVFVRMSYPTGFGGGGRGAPWAHDYPVGERHFLRILTAVSNVPAHTEQTSVMAFDDPEMFKFPVLYLVEPGYWRLEDGQANSLRSYLLKGGFLIVDDFPYWSWPEFEFQMSRVLPEARWIDLDVSHPIFHSFFDIETLDIVPAYPQLGEKPIFRAIFEDNDPSKRMYAVANYQNDLSEFWESSEEGRYIVDETNEAYKVGVNQFMYGITH